MTEKVTSTGRRIVAVARGCDFTPSTTNVYCSVEYAMVAMIPGEQYDHSPPLKKKQEWKKEKKSARAE